MVALTGGRTAIGPLTGGRTAFTFQPNGAPGAFITSQVMRAQTPEGLAVPWTVSFAAWTGNVITSGFAGATRARVTLVGGGEGAGGAATDVVLVDMPRAGTVFSVHAATVSVEVTTRMPGILPAAGMPTFSGWLGRGLAGGRQMSATLTELVRVVNDGQGFQEAVPSRARAFRIQFLTAVHTVSALQLDGASLGLVSDTLTLNPDAGHFLEASRAQWFPLHPDCVGVVVSNQDGVGSVGQWSVQWLLELG